MIIRYDFGLFTSSYAVKCISDYRKFRRDIICFCSILFSEYVLFTVEPIYEVNMYRRKKLSISVKFREYAFD